MSVLKGITTVGGLAGLLASAAIVAQAQVESHSKFNDAPIRVEKLGQLTRDIKHRFMLDHELVSGKVIEEGALERPYEGTTLKFSRYRIQTESGKTYNAVSRGDIFNVGNNVTLLLGAYDDCECNDSLRPIEAYQIN